MTNALLRRAAPLPLALFALACASTAPPPPATAPPPVAAAAPAPAAAPILAALLWVQTSAEYRALATQTYRAATRALDEALADSGSTAALEQTGDARALPPAVVVDVDETVLDNSPQDARAFLAGRGFEPEAWGAWVEEASAEPVPGAVEFARRAAELGVTLFYVTNRDAAQEAATRRNLARAGFPLPPDRDVVLLRGEREEWQSDKASRRAAVADSFRVLLVIGDDFNDFLPARASIEERDALLARHADRWGTRWFVLPNPVYGSWFEALVDFERGLAPEELDRRRRARLETEPDAP